MLDHLLGIHHRFANFSRYCFKSLQHKMAIRSHLVQSLIKSIIFLLLFNAAEGLPDVFCDRTRYGTPLKTDCYQALGRFPIERYTQYFVEEQMRSSPADMAYKGFRDFRPPAYRQIVVQLPKLISYGMPSIPFWDSK